MKRMARRPLVQFPDGSFYRESLDVTPRERLRQIVGVLFFAVVLIAVCLLSGGPQ